MHARTPHARTHAAASGAVFISEAELGAPLGAVASSGDRAAQRWHGRGAGAGEGEGAAGLGATGLAALSAALRHRLADRDVVSGAVADAHAAAAAVGDLDLSDQPAPPAVAALRADAPVSELLMRGQPEDNSDAGANGADAAEEGEGGLDREALVTALTRVGVRGAVGFDQINSIFFGNSVHAQLKESRD